jgi:hypothetical protein
VPAAPVNLSAVNNQNRTATVSWTDKADNETAFIIQRQKQNRGGRWSGITEIVVPADTLTHIDASGAGYYRYNIRAVNEAGSSPPTEWREVEVTRR